MRIGSFFTTALAAISLASTPVAATAGAPSAAILSPSAAAQPSAPAAARLEGESDFNSSYVVIGLVAIAVIIALILILDDDDDEAPTSP